MSDAKNTNREVVTQLVVEAICESFTVSSPEGLSQQSREILAVVRPENPIVEATAKDLNRFVDAAYEKGLDMDDGQATTALGAVIAIDIDHIIDASKAAAKRLAEADNQEFGSAYDVYMVKPTDLDITGPKKEVSPELEAYHDVCFHGSSAWNPDNMEHYQKVTSTYQLPGANEQESLLAVHSRMQAHGMDFRKLSAGDIIHDVSNNIHHMVEVGGKHFTPVATNQQAFIVHGFENQVEALSHASSIINGGSASWSPASFANMHVLQVIDRSTCRSLDELVVSAESMSGENGSLRVGNVVQEADSGDYHLLTQSGFEPIDVVEREKTIYKEANQNNDSVKTAVMAQ